MDQLVPNISNEQNEEFLDDSTTKNIRLTKAPSFSKPKLLSKNENKDEEAQNSESEIQFTTQVARKPKKIRPKPPIKVTPPKIWSETKIYVLPLMPSDAEEKYLSVDKEYRCSYCDELCDQANLECKVCSKVAHTACLSKRGYLDSPNVSRRAEWACSDCADLSKLLSDEEMQKIINVFERLDFRKDCFVKIDDYLEVKRQIYEEDGENKMTSEIELEEYRRFKLIDSSNSGAITWNDFVEFETADLLAKKNKVELSNHLSKKELIVAKRKFLSYDKGKVKMISKEDAKSCYLEYFKKLKEKLGNPFLEHISNCIDLFGFKETEQNKSSTAKTMWPEFIRKLTILLLYDRLNSSNYKPKSWKPGAWFQSTINTVNSSDNTSTTSKAISRTKFNPNIPRLSTAKRNLLPDENLNQVQEATTLFDVSQIMSEKMSLDSYRPHDSSDFGSYHFKIRSNKYAKKHAIKEELLNSEDEDELNRFPKFDFHSKFKFKHKKTELKEALVEDWLEKSQIETNSNNSLSNDSNEKQANLGFDYAKVTNDIYKTFGRIRKAINYPQQITVLSKEKPLKPTTESSLKNFYIPDLIENIKYSKHYFTSDNQSDQSNKSSSNNDKSYFHKYSTTSNKSSNNQKNMHFISRNTNSNSLSSALTKIQIDPLY